MFFVFLFTCCSHKKEKHNSAPKWAPLFRFGFATDFLGYITVHDTLLSYDLGDDGYFVAGHMNHVGNRNDILTNQAFTNAVIAAVHRSTASLDLRTVLSENGLLDPNNPRFYNKYLSTSLARKARQDECVRLTLGEVGCTMAGADVVLPTLCSAAGFYVSVEW